MARPVRKLQRLGIRSVQHLSLLLGCAAQTLNEVAAERHKYYRSRIEEKGGKERELHVPNRKLKGIQKKLNVLMQRLDFPSYVQAGLKGRSNVTNASFHCSKPMVLKSDIRSFFPSVTEEMVYKAFRKKGCSCEIAELLTALTTFKNQLPQGAPSSTIVANLVVERLCFRLAKLAQSHGATFTQYVDDLVFSGPAHLERMKGLVHRIIEEEGFTCHPFKLVALSREVEQVVTGVAVNNGRDIPNRKLKEVRSTLAQLESQTSVLPEELASLQGKVGYIRQLNKGAHHPLQKRLHNIKSELSLNSFS